MARGGTRLNGVIDTLSTGYGVVNRHPWIVLIPVLLDLFLWLGPQASAAPLVSRVLSGAMALDSGRDSVGVLDQAQVRDLVGLSEEFNLFSALGRSSVSVISVPSLIAVLGVRDPLRSVPVDSWGIALAIVLGSVVGGMLLGSLYYAILAQEVRDGAVSLVRLVGQALRSWLRVLQYLLLITGMALMFGLPVLFLGVSAALMSPVLGSLALSAATMALIWTGIYLFFVPNAIFLSQVGPLQAVKNSFAVVRGNFWAAVGLIGLTTVVWLGMTRVWELASTMIDDPWGIGVGILGNAYIVTGLIAASFIFYRERIERVSRRQEQTAV
jgi:hypothetical protein